MKKLNSKGFSVIEGFLVLVILGIIGGTGFYVYSKNQDKFTGDNGSEIAKNEKKERNATSQSADQKIYTNSELPFSFEYPAKWLTKLEEGSTPEFYTVLVEAPQTKLEGLAYPTTVSGAQIRIYKKSKKDYETIRELKNKDPLAKFWSNAKNVSIDGREGIQYDVSYEGPASHIVVFYENKMSYSISLEKEIYQKTEYRKIFDSLINSVRFN
jgi:type II secretory pathway pseudopilin PulG